MSGGPGRDYVFGGSGADVLKGGNDNDWVDAQEDQEQGVDRLRGGRGNDLLTAFNLNSRRDIVRCGAGRDHAEVDPKDIVADDCERIRRID
jgi:Ca2+-binding RTX toxin-like protein